MKRSNITINFELRPGIDDEIIAFYKSLPRNGRGREGVTRHLRAALNEYIDRHGLASREDSAARNERDLEVALDDEAHIDFPDDF